MNITEVVEKYIALRDKKAALKRDYEAKVEAIDQMLDKVETLLLTNMQEQGVDSYKTPAGTAYKSVRASASVADRESFMRFIQETGEWSMLDVRANKTAVQEYREANNDLPPGVNWSEQIVVNIRRS